MSEVLAQREAVMVGLPMARWIDNIRENRSFFHDNCYRLFVQAHRCWCHCHCRERNRGKFHRLSKSDFWEFESFPFTGAAICGHPGLSFPGWVATGTEGRGCHTGRILPLYDQQNIWNLIWSLLGSFRNEIHKQNHSNHVTHQPKLFNICVYLTSIDSQSFETIVLSNIQTDNPNFLLEYIHDIDKDFPTGSFWLIINQGR